MGTSHEVGSTNVITYWKAFQASTGEEYSGTDILHTATGLTLSYTRSGAATVSVAVGETEEPEELTAVDAAHLDWAFGKVSGDLYRADFPDAAFAAGVPSVYLKVGGVAGVVFVRVAVDDLVGGDPRATPVTPAAIVAAEKEAIGDYTRPTTTGTMIIDGTSYTCTIVDGVVTRLVIV